MERGEKGIERRSIDENRGNGIGRPIDEEQCSEELIDLTIQKRESCIFVFDQSYLLEMVVSLPVFTLLRTQASCCEKRRRPSVTLVMMQIEPFLQKTTRLGDPWDLKAKLFHQFSAIQK